MKSTLIVAGLGRCGTTAVMRELDAAGFPVIGGAPNYEHEIDPLGPVPSGAFKWTSLEWDANPGWFMDFAPGQALSVLWMHRRDAAEWRKSFLHRRADSELVSLSPRMAGEWDRFLAGCEEAKLGAVEAMRGLGGAWIDRLRQKCSRLQTATLAFEDLLADPGVLENYFPGRGYQWGREIRKRSSRVPRVPLELELIEAGPPTRYRR